MLAVVIVNRLLRNVGRQGVLGPGQGGEHDGHLDGGLVLVGVLDCRGVEGRMGGRGGRGFTNQNHVLDAAAHFCFWSARYGEDYRSGAPGIRGRLRAYGVGMRWLTGVEA